MVLAVVLLMIVTGVFGHEKKQFNDADLQSSLMPQELNPAFVSGKDGPWKSVMPLPRTRRSSANVDVVDPPNTDTATGYVKMYSRIIACIVLVVSAAIEIVVYIIEAYQVNAVVSGA